MTEDQIKHMVDRFLGWRLPENFAPDAGISFTRLSLGPQVGDAPRHYVDMPVGTNLFDATQAQAMVLYMLAGLRGASTGAQAIISGSKIEISIDIEALPQIVSGSCCADGMDGLWKVTDPTTFAKEVCHALNDESEDGTTPVHVMFDKAFMAAIEQGAEGIEEVSDDEFEAEAARLQAEARATTGGSDGR